MLPPWSHSGAVGPCPVNEGLRRVTLGSWLILPHGAALLLLLAGAQPD